jgi:dTDP-4-dehydrorhamnose reductase
MVKTRPILVTGCSGQVGGAIKRLAAQRGRDIYAPDRTLLDLRSDDSIAAVLSAQPWQAVINCAAYTAVDKAEKERDLAYRVNAEAPAVLARETERRGIPLVHVSTDYVFDGTKSTPYVENDPTNPLGVYGQTKHMGEMAIREHSSNYAIVRTAWVMSTSGSNFLDTMLNLGSYKSELRIINDQIGSPSSADDIADALLRVTDNLGDRSGTWHFVNSGEATWYDVASLIFSKAGKHGATVPLLTPITTAEYPTLAKRPKNSRLATTAIESDFGIKPAVWQVAINSILDSRLS